MILSILNCQEINCLGKGKDIGMSIIILEYILIGHLTRKTFKRKCSCQNMQDQRVVALFSALKQLLKLQGKKHKETKQLNHPKIKIKIEFCSSLTLRGDLVPLNPSWLPDTISRIFYYPKTNMTGVGF